MIMSNYLFSKYNIMCKGQNGKTILYNSASDEFLELDNSTQNTYQQMLENELINLSSFPLFNIFLEKGFVVPSWYNEWELIDNKFLKEVYSDDELVLTILTTNACNFRCVYCYEKHGNEFMSLETTQSLLKFIDRATSSHFSKLHVSWFGGEPLLTKDLIIETSKQIKRIALKNKIAYVAQITTNGYDLSVDLFEQLLKCNILTYNITIDGIQSVHDRQRPHVSGDKTYSNILNNLIQIKNQIKTNRFSIYIRTNIGESGLSTIYEFANIYLREFGNDFRFHFMLEPIREKNGEDTYKFMSRYKEVYELYHQLSEKGIQVASYLQLKDMSHICSAVYKNGLVIDWDGNVCKCSTALFSKDFRDDNVIGQIDNNGELLIDLKKEARWMVRDLDKYQCHECKMYPKCLGIKCIFRLKYTDSISEKCPFFNSYLSFVEANILLNKPL